MKTLKIATYGKGDIKTLLSFTISKAKVLELEQAGAEPQTSSNTLTLAYMNKLLSAIMQNKKLQKFINSVKSGNKFVDQTEEEKQSMKPYFAELNRFRYFEIPMEDGSFRYFALVNLGEISEDIIHHQINRMFNIAYELNFYFKDTEKNTGNLKKAINYATAIQNEYIKAVASKNFYEHLFREEKGSALQALTADIPHNEVWLPKATINFLTGGKFDEMNNKEIIARLQEEELNVEVIRHPILNHINIQRVTGIAPYGCIFVTEGVLETLLQGDTDGDQLFVYLFDKGVTTTEEDIANFRPQTFLGDVSQDLDKNGTTLDLASLCKHYEGKKEDVKEYVKSADKNVRYNNWQFKNEEYKEMLVTTLMNLISVKEGVALSGYWAKCLDLIICHNTKEIAEKLGVSQAKLRVIAKSFIRNVKETALDIKHGTSLMEEQPWFYIVQNLRNNGKFDMFVKELKEHGIEIENAEKLVAKYSKKEAESNNIAFEFERYEKKEIDFSQFL